MIDLFHDVYPQYQHLFTEYIEKHLKSTKLYISLTTQIMLIGCVFEQDFTNTDRIWLT